MFPSNDASRRGLKIGESQVPSYPSVSRFENLNGILASGRTC